MAVFLITWEYYYATVFVCPAQHWMSIWHSHGHTHRIARTHVVPYTGSAQSDHLSIFACLSIWPVVYHCSSLSNDVCFVITKPSDSELQRPLKQHGDASIQHWSRYNENAHLDRLLERMGHCDHCTVGKQCCLTSGGCSICVVFHNASVLFVICLLTKCESASDWNWVQAEQGLLFLGTCFGLSYLARAINQHNKSVIYHSSLLWDIHLIQALVRGKYKKNNNIWGSIRINYFKGLSVQFYFVVMQLGMVEVRDSVIIQQYCMWEWNIVFSALLLFPCLLWPLCVFPPIYPVPYRPSLKSYLPLV